MKTITINTAASWGSGLSSWLDGDIFRESNTDIWTTDIGDRLGYLKAQSDITVKTTGTQTVAGDKTFSGATTMSGGLAVTGGDLDFSGAGTATFDRPLTLNEVFTANSYVQLLSRVILSFPETLADANATLATDETMHRIPSLTANRVYTLPNGIATGAIKFITRGSNGGAFTATIQDVAGRTMCVIPASTQGWIAVYRSGGSEWQPFLWSSGLTSLLNEV